MGKSPPEPWIEWNKVGFFAETSPFNYLLIDTFHTQVRLESVTFFEDGSHPESWLRDGTLEYWDPVTDTWKLAAALLPDAARHVHPLPKPVEASRFRVVFPRASSATCASARSCSRARWSARPTPTCAGRSRSPRSSTTTSPTWPVTRS
ncbi:MAG: hypothetical protein ACREIT_05200 [Tepidisphaeraceae bacterium]